MQTRVRLEAAEFQEIGDKIVASSRWLDELQDLICRVCMIREGRIIDWQDCRTRRPAQRFARER